MLTRCCFQLYWWLCFMVKENSVIYKRWPEMWPPRFHLILNIIEPRFHHLNLNVLTVLLLWRRCNSNVVQTKLQ